MGEEAEPFAFRHLRQIGLAKRVQPVPDRRASGVNGALFINVQLHITAPSCGDIEARHRTGVDKRERDRIIADFKAERLRFLVSQGVLTTGFNARHVDLIALARPTKSTGLYIQMIGRGTRLSPETGKANCLILDFGGNIARHGPFDDPAIPDKKSKGEGPAPYKTCPECECVCGTMTAFCPACGFEFPPPDGAIPAGAGALPYRHHAPETRGGIQDARPVRPHQARHRADLHLAGLPAALRQ